MPRRDPRERNVADSFRLGAPVPAGVGLLARGDLVKVPGYTIGVGRNAAACP